MVSNTTVDDPRIINEINILKDHNVFSLDDGTQIDISYNSKGWLCYDDNGTQKSIRSLVMLKMRLQSARWLNHLYFKMHKEKHLCLKHT